MSQPDETDPDDEVTLVWRGAVLRASLLEIS